MATSQAELKAVATLDNKQFISSAQQIEGAVGKTSSALGSMAAKIGGAFIAGAAIKEAAEYIKKLAEESARLERFAKTVGMSAITLHELGEAAEKSGASADGFNSKIVKLLESQEKAVGGDKDLISAFNNLGISIDQLQSLSPDQLLLAVSQGAQKSATSIHNLNQVMGKGAAAEYGGVLGDIAKNGLPKVDEQAEKANRTFARLHATIKGLSASFGMAVKGGVAGLIDFFAGGEGGMEGERINKDRAFQNDARLAGIRKEREEARSAAVQAIQLKAQEQNNDLLKRRAKDIDNITVGSPVAASAMGAMGRNIGSAYQGTGGVEERQLKELEIISKYSEEMSKNTMETNKAIEKLGSE